MDSVCKRGPETGFIRASTWGFPRIAIAVVYWRFKTGGFVLQRFDQGFLGLSYNF